MIFGEAHQVQVSRRARLRVRAARGDPGHRLSQQIEVTRVVAEAVQGIVIGGLLTPLGLFQAISAYSRPLGIRAGWP